MRLGGWVVVWLCFSGCAIEETPYDACMAAGEGCCKNRDCGSDAICDYDYTCDPRIDGSLACTEPVGDQQCHDLCELDSDCAGGGQCLEIEQTQGPNGTDTLFACF